MQMHKLIPKRRNFAFSVDFANELKMAKDAAKLEYKVKSPKSRVNVQIDKTFDPKIVGTIYEEDHLRVL
jgi:hypothetical protein